MNDSRNDRN